MGLSGGREDRGGLQDEGGGAAGGARGAMRRYLRFSAFMSAKAVDKALKAARKRKRIAFTAKLLGISLAEARILIRYWDKVIPELGTS